MIILLALNAFLVPIIGQPSSVNIWPNNWQHIWHPNSRNNSEASSSRPKESQPTSGLWYDQIVKSRGYSEVSFYRDDQVFFIDSISQNLCSYHTANRNIFCVRIGKGTLYFAVPVLGHPDKFVVGCDQNILMVRWNSFENWELAPHYVFQPMEYLPLRDRDQRTGYGAVDHQNRLWFVTTNDITSKPHEGTLYCLDSSMVVHRRLRDMSSVTGGFVWYFRQPGPREPRPHLEFYQADPQKREILRYRINDSPEILEKRDELFLFKKLNVRGRPGRPAIDERGWLWVPLLGGNGVYEMDPFTPALGRFYKLPAAQVGACSFGGPNWETLYVSTIKFEFVEFHQQPPLRDQGGNIYAIHGLTTEDGLPVRGVPTREYFLDERSIAITSAVLDPHISRHSHDGGTSRSGGYRGRRVQGGKNFRDFDLNLPGSNYL